jgi:hypothetical protein
MMMKIKTFFSMEELIYIHIPTLQSKIKNAKKHICIMIGKFAKKKNVIEDKKYIFVNEK